MSYFNENEINEAKRRVREMQNKASSFAQGSEEIRQDKNNDKIYTESPKKEEQHNTENKEKQDSSLFIILALLILLSKEEADNSLLLALLYLLL